METPNSTDSRTSSGTGSAPSSSSDRITVSSSRSYGIQFPPALRYLRTPLSSLLDHSGLLRVRPDNSDEADPLIFGGGSRISNSDRNLNTNGEASIATRSTNVSSNTTPSLSSSNGEVSIRIFGPRDGDRVGSDNEDDDSASAGGVVDGVGQDRNFDGAAEAGDSSINGNGDNGSNRGDSSYQRYDIQQLARWVEQILPFSLLLLVAFIRQHLQGFFHAIWISAFMFKSNDILKKHTALKGNRRIFVLIGYLMVFVLHVLGIYWWYRNVDIYYPLFMVPPKSIPPFWHAVFIILVNDTMVRQTAMAAKLALLIYYKNDMGHNFRRQGQMLTLVEYTLLLYRALLPAPVWYRFFLNKEYGSLFSSLTTGLYLTFKLRSIVEKVQSFLAALKAFSRKEINYGLKRHQSRYMKQGICVLFARRRCIFQFCCAANTYFVKIVWLNGLKERELARCAGYWSDQLL